MRIGHRLVAGAVEMREHRRGRGQRHFVLARPAAVEHADAKTFHAERIQELGMRRS